MHDDTIIKPRGRAGFTLIEILVVIGIIVILLSIAIPVVSKVRKAAAAAAVQAQLNDLAGSINQYQLDHGAFPGPLAYNQIRMPSGFTMNPDTAAAGAAGFAGTLDATKITMAENAVLGLAGGLEVVTGGPGVTIQYDPTLVGGGAMSLNPASPKKGKSYIDQKNLSWREVNGQKTGKYQDGAAAADDSEIPEILDTFSSPMPILYLRARKGQQPPAGPVSGWDADTNHIITQTAEGTPPTYVGQYDLSQIIAYTSDLGGGYIGEGKSIAEGDYTAAPTGNSKPAHGLRTATPTAAMEESPSGGKTYQYPYDAFPYFRDPASTDANPTPRAKDGFILISAGVDRVYGTPDDITSFGPVNP